MSEPQQRISQRLAELVQIPSVSAVDAAFDMSNSALVGRLAEWYEAAGFSITVQDVGATPHKQNLIARLGPSQVRAGDGLVLSGHTDTVPYDADRWRGDPFVLREENGCWFGLGSADMKCFFPIVLAAVEGLDCRQLRAPLTLLATADEESSMAGARALVDSGEPLGRFALIGEPTELVPIHKHKGIVIARIAVTGHSGHSSDPALGANALDCMHDIISGLKRWRESAAERYRDRDFAVPGPTLNLGRISGGDSPNRICAECELLFDIRLMPGMDIENTLEEIRTLVAACCGAAGVSGALSLPMVPLAAMETAPDSRLLRELVALSGNAPQTVAFATEGPFLNAVGCESIIFGPGNISTAHQPNEYVEIERVMRMVSILRQLIERLCCDG